jgi:ribose 5-phosphate isomerase RpiB
VVSSDSEAEEELEQHRDNVDTSKLSLHQQDESFAEFSAKYRAFHKHEQEMVENARYSTENDFVIFTKGTGTGNSHATAKDIPVRYRNFEARVIQITGIGV